MKTGPDALGTVEKRVWARKTLKRDSTPSVPSKMSPGAQYMKTGLVTLVTAENGSTRAKHENWTRRPLTAENEFRRTKHENGTCRPLTAENEFGRTKHINRTRRTRHG
jgi:hypothetical protein